MNTYSITAVLRQPDGMEREVEARVTHETELQARRLFLERVWAHSLLCSAILEVRQIAWRNK